MSIAAERALVGLLTDSDSLTYLAREGIETQILPTEEVRPVVEWALQYRTDGGKAPTRAVLADRFEHELEVAGIDLADQVEETIEWALDKLRTSHVQAGSHAFARDLSTSITDADDEDKIDVLAEKAAELAALVQAVSPRRGRIDIRNSGAGLWEQYQAVQARGGAPEGMMLGFPEVDDYTGGIWAGELAMVIAPQKVGKAQPLDGLVLTPTGYRMMGDLTVGDLVIGSDGRPTRIVGVHPQGEMPIYRVEVSDRTFVEVCGDHLWYVMTSDQKNFNRPGTVLSTIQIRERLLSGDRRGSGRMCIPVVDPVQFESMGDLPLDPYALGLLLGDGGFRGGVPIFTTFDPELVESLAPLLPSGVSMVPLREGAYSLSSGGTRSRRNPLTEILSDLGLYGHKSSEKYIPEIYLRASVNDRLALLQGLMDTDGGMEKTKANLTTSSPRLADDVQHLVESLGGTAARRTKLPTYRHHGELRTGLPATTLRIRIALSLGCPFRLKRKVDAWSISRPSKNCPPVRKIDSVEYVGIKPAQCITVEAADHLYLADHCLVTHNSFALDYGAKTSWENERIGCLFTLENSIDMTVQRLGCMVLHIPLDDLMHGMLDPEDADKLRWWCNDVLPKSDVPLHIFNPPPSMRTPQAMVQQARAVGCEDLFLDQLTFMEAIKATSREGQPERVGRMLHDTKALISTGRHPMSCLMAHQLSREGIEQAEKTGRVSANKGANTSEVERTVDWLFGLNWSEMQRIAGRMGLQTLAARRAKELKDFELLWAVNTGHFKVLWETVR